MHRIAVAVSFILTGCLIPWLPLVSPARQGPPAEPYSPRVAPASKEALLGLKQIRIPRGFQIDLVAAEPLLANPVCFCIDEHNRFYVAETFRIHHGAEDDREHMAWLDDDLAARTVADRVALFRKHLGEKVKDYTVEHDRVRLIEDTNGDGKADRSTVFADGFHHIPDGIGAGLLARGGNVWYTCIPDLWLLRDTRGTGKADVRQSLSHGWGVHVSFYGHDMHGLKMGPDGKLYFSIGDRGFNVVSGGQRLAYPDTGAVLRCNPDGSELEVVASGLRNPQELAFDDYGNLFTGDNNADHGDKARWVYVVEGGDSGWRIGYQYLQWPEVLGPWKAERLWEPAWPGQAAYIVPPIANVADGPAGLVYYPGVGLSERYRGHFFLCDFRGTSGISGIRSFAVKPRGAAFEFVDQHQFIWSVLATDVDFGTDSALYVLDWVDGWTGTGKGRIYRVADPAHARDPEVLAVKKLLAEGMTQRPQAELVKFLGHPDLRIRQEAQFALAARGRASLAAFAAAARKDGCLLARLHAIWGLGQLGRKAADACRPLVELLADPDAEVRAQAARVLGDDHHAAAEAKLLPLVKDPQPRVQFFAIQSLGKLGSREAIGPILQLLRANADRDAYLRHAAVMALTAIHDPAALQMAAHDPSAAVRLAALLVLRRLESPAVARFLKDPEPRLVLEAARAIYDVPIPAALPDLAALSERSALSEPLGFRVLNANFRLGKPTNAAAVAAFAARAAAPELLRIEALRELTTWTRPSGRDRVMGLWRPIGSRPAAVAVDALRPVLPGIFQGPDRVRQEAIQAVAQLGIREAGPLLLALLADRGQSVEVRRNALRALDTLRADGLARAMELALAAADPDLRMEGRRLQARLHPEQVLPGLEDVLQHGSVRERQAALSILGEMPGAGAEALLARQLARLLAGHIPPAIQLDLLEAARRHSAPAIQQQLARYEASRSKNDPLAGYRECLAGGHARAGRDVFFLKEEVACVRCHKVQGTGGDVGPNLTGIGSRQKRDYLLESIVDPNRQIAKGFETVVFGLENGQIVAGIVKAEDSKEVRLVTAEGKVLTVPRPQIVERTRGKSAMPEDLVKQLSKAELRDLVEFLASLK